MTEETCHTFDTEAEARAFMLGFRAAASDGICPWIDPEERQAVLVDCIDTETTTGDEAASYWYACCCEYKTGALYDRRE